MKAEEFEGKNVEQAIEAACRHFNVSVEDLKIEIITHGSTGLFGIGAKKARIRAALKPEVALKKRQEEAEKVLRALLAAAGFDILAEGRSEEEKILIELKGQDREYLLDKGGAPLNALQYLVNKIVARRLGVGPKIVIDVEGFRSAREKQLRSLARKTAQQVRKTGRPAELPPMPSQERRLIHLTVKEIPGVETKSKGQGANRRVVIYPKRRSNRR